LFLFETEPRQIQAGRRSIPIAGSIAAHLLLLAWISAAPRIHTPSTYDQLIRPQETHLVWYSFKRKLPDVSPARQDQNKPLLAERLEKQVTISAPKDAPKAEQMIFHPTPVIQPQPPVPLPNIIALAAPPPPRREFVPPRPVPRQQETAQVAEVSPAPEVKTSTKALDLIKMAAVARPFVPPPDHRAKPTLKTALQVDAAPEVKAGAADGAASKVLDQGSRAMAFRPQPMRSATASVGALPDAPSLGNLASNANVAVVGLNPIDKLNVPLPSGSRPAQFSAGPKLNRDGATSAGTASGITVPDLFIRGGDKSSPATLLARTYNSPTSLESLHGALREGAHPAPEDGIGKGAGVPVSGAPDPRFLGRQVYSVAIQSPNLTSHSGSWLMWYSDRAELTYRAMIYAPRPLHEVDPKYVATAAEERVEGTVRLVFVIGSDGRVSGVELVKGVDDRLDRSAMEALRKWQFSPAIREGKAVDVDALVEIPFRLPPPPIK
jgi:TonB family protein